MIGAALPHLLVQLAFAARAFTRVGSLRMSGCLEAKARDGRGSGERSKEEGGDKITPARGMHAVHGIGRPTP